MLDLTNASPDQVAAAIVAESIRRGHARDETIAELSTAIQESGLRMVWDPSRRWFGYYQQDSSYPNRMDPLGNIRGFLDRLEPKRRGQPGASDDPWLNIFWLQQRPSEDSADDAFNDPRARRAYLTEIKRHIDRATVLYDRFTNMTAKPEKPMAWTGDPVWLEDVLRPALGDRLKTLAGWQDSGHGDFKDIRGVMVHHTGNSRESAESIRNGRPDLPGPLSNLHIAPDGTVTIVAVGVCWHAGVGSYPWLPTNMANWHMIGIECAWPTPRPDLPLRYDPNERWPDAQIISMRDTCAALCLKLGHPATRVIGHKEYAGAAQGKWDPGNMSMPWFRGEVAKDMRGEFDSEPPVQPPVPGPVEPPILAPPPNPRTDRVLLEEVWDQVRGPGGRGWPQLGGKTVVDYLAELGGKVDALTEQKAGQD